MSATSPARRFAKRFPHSVPRSGTHKRRHTQTHVLTGGVGCRTRQGYALLCVAYPDSDLEVELQDPEEVYEMQFGKSFAAQALDKQGASIQRDDFALELAEMDE